MTVPESQPLTEEEKDTLACRCHEAICPLHNEASDGYIEHEVGELISTVEALLATRTAALLDRLKAVEELAERARIERADYGQRALRAEADKARAVAAARVDGYVLALREVAAAYIEQAPNGAVKTTDLILWLQAQADEIEAREEVSGS